MHIGIAHLGEVRRQFMEVQRQDSRIEEHTREEVGILISLWYFRLVTPQKTRVLADFYDQKVTLDVTYGQDEVCTECQRSSPM
jgi:hypothetical protein